MMKKLGAVILWLGVVCTAYGALVFFWLHDLPPNSPSSGRLHSIYLMFAGMGVMLVGAFMRNFKLK
jgi:hypothetical protein